MKTKALFLAIALSMIASPLLAQESQAPVTVTESSVFPQSSGTERNTPGQVMIEFVNHRDVPASVVTFALVGGGRTLATVQCLGTFAKDVAIRHSFATQTMQRDQTIELSSVMFKDGSVWMAGQMIVDPAKALWQFSPVVLTNP